MGRFQNIGRSGTIGFINTGKISCLQEHCSVQLQAGYQGIVVGILAGTCFSFFRPEYSQCAGRQLKNIPAGQFPYLRAVHLQFLKQRSHIRMNILFPGSGRKKNEPDGNLILNQGMKATHMICVQVCQDNSIRGQTPGAQEAAENTVILPGVHDINFIVVPKHSRVSVSGAELYIFRYVMGNRKQGDNQRSRTEGQQCGAYPAVQSDKPAEAEKEKHKSGSCR